jgi:hypothetical protein
VIQVLLGQLMVAPDRENDWEAMAANIETMVKPIFLSGSE